MREAKGRTVVAVDGNILARNVQTVGVEREAGRDIASPIVWTCPNVMILNSNVLPGLAGESGS
jgi:hypothetical protein